MRPSRCDRWPRSLRLVSSGGRFVPGRCRATNKCDYCARLEAVETSEMLALDAVEGGNAPRVWMVLTTREPVVLMRQSPEACADQQARFNDARRLVARAIRRRWPHAEYVSVVEFTTGYGTRAGGKRRPHWNWLVKGVDVSDAAELEAIVARVWCGRVDAEPDAQFVGEVAEVGGLMRYLALHFLKESQRPPDGWRGQRVTASRGYFGAKVPQGHVTARGRARLDARKSLRLKREVYAIEHAEGRHGDPSVPTEAAVRQLIAEGERWELARLSIDTETGEVLGARRIDGRELTVYRRDRTADLSRRIRGETERAAWERDRLAGDRWVAPIMPRQLVLLSVRRD